MRLRCLPAAAFALCAALCPSAQAQLETRGDRDAAGLRGQIEEMGELPPTLDELSQAYDRASASWLEVFGPEPFGPAARGALRAVSALSAKGWAPRGHVVVSMLDARGDAAWEEDGSCRAQVNIGSDGSSPSAKSLGPGAFEFIAAHELAHCLFDQADPAGRLPREADLLSASFPLSLTSAQALSIVSMLAKNSSEDGSQGLSTAYDEALADALASSALIALDPALAQPASRALALRMGAIFLAERAEVGPPPHLGAYAIWSSLSGGGARSLPEARALAAASAVIHSLASTPARWALALKAADPGAYADLVAQSREAAAALAAGRDREADEAAYLGARNPSLFIMDISVDGPGADSPKERPQLTPAESMGQWRAAAWLPSP